tara:strand:+ start:233 stop:439 length:207 start_codon:yes stop_codon:yes gene_type:complete
MTTLLENLAKDTDNLLGLGTVTKIESNNNVYGYLHINTKENALKVEALLNKAFTKLDVIRDELRIMVG